MHPFPSLPLGFRSSPGILPGCTHLSLMRYRSRRFLLPFGFHNLRLRSSPSYNPDTYRKAVRQKRQKAVDHFRALGLHRPVAIVHLRHQRLSSYPYQDPRRYWSLWGLAVGNGHDNRQGRQRKSWGSYGQVQSCLLFSRGGKSVNRRVPVRSLRPEGSFPLLGSSGYVFNNYISDQSHRAFLAQRFCHLS